MLTKYTDATSDRLTKYNDLNSAKADVNLCTKKYNAAVNGNADIDEVLAAYEELVAAVKDGVADNEANIATLNKAIEACVVTEAAEYVAKSAYDNAELVSDILDELAWKNGFAWYDGVAEAQEKVDAARAEIERLNGEIKDNNDKKAEFEKTLANLNSDDPEIVKGMYNDLVEELKANIAKYEADITYYQQLCDKLEAQLEAFSK